MTNCPTLTETEQHAQALTDAVQYADDQLEHCAGVIECQTDSDYEDGRSINRTLLTFHWESGRDAKDALRDVLKEFVDYLS